MMIRGKDGEVAVAFDHSRRPPFLVTFARPLAAARPFIIRASLVLDANVNQKKGREK
jgi:hypothetical protein